MSKWTADDFKTQDNPNSWTAEDFKNYKTPDPEPSIFSKITTGIDNGMKYIGNGIGNSISNLEANHPWLASKIAGGLNSAADNVEKFNNTTPMQMSRAAGYGMGSMTGNNLLNQALIPDEYQKDKLNSEEHPYSTMAGAALPFIASGATAGGLKNLPGVASFNLGEKFATSLLPKVGVVGKDLIGKIAQTGLKTGFGMAAANGLEGGLSGAIDYAQGKDDNPMDILSKAGQGARSGFAGGLVLGGVGRGLGEGVGIASKGINSAMDAYKNSPSQGLKNIDNAYDLYKDNGILGFKQTNSATSPRISQVGNIIKDIQTGTKLRSATDIPETLALPAPKENPSVIYGLPTIEPKPILPNEPLALPPGRDMPTQRTSAIEMPPRGVYSSNVNSGEYKIKNTELEKAHSIYNDAIEQLKNTYGTSDIQGYYSDILNSYAEPGKRTVNVTPQMALDFVKRDTGIDLNGLVDNIKTAETKPVLPDNDYSRLKRVSGIASDKSYALNDKLKQLSDIYNGRNIPKDMPIEQTYKVPEQYQRERISPFRLSPDQLPKNPLPLKPQPTLREIAENNLKYQVPEKYRKENLNFFEGGASKTPESILRQGNEQGNINSPSLSDYASKSILSANKGIQSEIPGAMGADKRIKLNIRLNQQEPLSNYKYIDTTPVKFDEGHISDKATAQDIRNSYSGILNKQKIMGIHLAEDMGKLAPKEQEALTIFNEANGNRDLMQSWLDDQNPILDKYKPYIKQAMNLSPEAQKAKSMMKQYYTEQGEFSKKMGTTKDIIENYNNRIYKPDVEGSPMDKIKKTEQIRTEIRNSGLNTYTKHSKERVYPTIIDAILNGKEPATLKANDLLSIHNEELARVNTNRKLADALQQTGFGGYIKGDKLPKGMVEIPSLSKIFGDKYVVPEGIGEGLKAITDTASKFGKIDKYQGLVKTVDLALSAFHHITMVAQSLYQGEVKNLASLGKLGNLLDTDSFRNLEKDFIMHTGTTSKLEANQDVLRSIRGQEGLLGKITDVPGIKQIAELSDKNSQYLFGKMQRWLKVMDYNNKLSKWIGKNEGVSEDGLVTAKRQIAREVNAAYGGLNWQSLGITQPQLRVMRRVLLAPDWTYSNVDLAKQLFDKGAGGNIARKHFTTALVGGYLFGNAVNKIMSGKWMSQNEKGHEMEIEMSKGVYISPFRGFIGDVLKLGTSIESNGVIGGSAKYAQNKLAPFARTALGVTANKDVTGKNIYNTKDSFAKKTLDGTKFIAKSASPIPFSVSSTSQYLGSGDATPLGTLAVGSGIARYSKKK